MTLHLESMTLRVLIVEIDSLRVSTVRTATGYQIPRVEIALGQRKVRQAQAAVLSTWGANVVILEFVGRDDPSSDLVLAELLSHERSSCLESVPMQQIAQNELSEREKDRVMNLGIDRDKAIFSRMGWYREAAEWIRSATGVSVSPKNRVEQYNTAGPFALIRFATSDGRRYWLKAVGEPNLHEFPINCLLSRAAGVHVPTIVSTKPEWNAWLMLEDGHPVDESEDAPLPLGFLQSAVRSLAALQINTMGRKLEFFQAGVSDHTSNVLGAHGIELFDFLEMAMALQTSTRALRVDVSRLREILEILRRVSDYAARMPIPDSILHGDLNLGNILQCATHCQFIDWSDAFFGNPIITFEHLLLLNRAESPDSPMHREQFLRDLYVSAMSTVCDPEMIRKAFALSPLLAAASTLYGRGKWLSNPDRNDPRRQAFGRTLARHMDRAANDPRLLAQVAS
jgi:hypothetical protein